MNKDLIVVGFAHNKKAKSFPKVLEYVNENVKAGERIGVESPFCLEKIFTEFAALEAKPNLSSRDYHYLALHDLCKTIQEKNAVVVVMEDERLYRLAALYHTWYMFEDKEGLAANKGFQLVTVKRSIALWNRALEQHCSRLFTGTVHAYHLQKLGYCSEPVFISDISEKSTVYENTCLELYKKHIELKERKINK